MISNVFTLAPSRMRAINIGAAVLAVLWVCAIYATLDPYIDDFRQYWQAGINLSATGDAYATTPAPDAPQSAPRGVAYPNPPLLAWLIRPLSRLAYEPARTIWFGLNSMMLACVIAWSIRLSGSSMARSWWGLVALLTVVAPPVRLGLQLGQVSTLLTFLIIGSAWLVRAAQPRRAPTLGAGIALGLAIAIKLYPALLILAYLFRSRRLGLYALLGTALVGILSVLATGISQHDIYLHKVVLGGYYPYQAEFNISWVGFWQRLLTPSKFAVSLADAPALATLAVLVCGLATLGLCIWSMRRAQAHTHVEALSLWLCAMLLLSPVNGYYNLLALLLPILVLVRHIEHQQTSMLRGLVVLATALCWVPPGWTWAFPGLYTFAHTGIGLVFLSPALYGVLAIMVLVAAILQHSAGHTRVIATACPTEPEPERMRSA